MQDEPDVDGTLRRVALRCLNPAMGMLRGTIAVLMLIVGLTAVGSTSPASAHQNGCHAQHSCPSDASPPTYICGDTGNYTYCPNLSGYVVASGTGATVGSTINAYVSWSVAIVGPVTYQWFRSGAAVPGAVSPSYNVSAEDVGQALVLTASATDGRGQAATSSSSPITPAFPTLPVGSATLSPTTATVGTVMSAAVQWSRPAVANYQWFRGALPIPDAVGPSYTVTADDLGVPLKVVATVTEYGRATAVESAPVTPVADARLTLTAPKKVLAGKKVVLRGALSTVAGVAGRSVSVKAWQKVGRRWVLRNKAKILVSTAGTFAAKQKTDRKHEGKWKFKAYYTGTPGVRSVESGYAITRTT